MVKKTYTLDSETIAIFMDRIFEKLNCSAPKFEIIEDKKKVGEGVWVSDNKIEFKKNKKEFGAVTLPASVDGTALEVSGDIIIKICDELMKKKEEADKNKATPAKLKDSIFEKLFDNLSQFGGIEKNFKLLKKFEEQLVSTGIEKVDCTQNVQIKRTTIYETPTILFSLAEVNDGRSISGGYDDQFRNIMWAKYGKGSSYSSKDYIMCSSQGSVLTRIIFFTL